LYIGTGSRSKLITSEIRKLANKVKSLQIVVDGLRQSRCMESFNELRSISEIKTSRIRCFQNELARKMPSKLLGRFMEAFGVHHMKYYVFDDTTILTG
jgi:phosphatidylserine/phosphatidylglycerophosphate/cardiolipin synthase-like enzyme